MFPLAQLLVVASALASASPSVGPRPFKIGERAVYDVKFGLVIGFNAGTASMEVAGVDTVRGRDAFRFVFTVNGGALTYSIRDTIRSWVDTSTFHGLRFTQDQVERGKTRKRRYEVFPDRAVYSESGKPEMPSVPNPLDETAFLYFVRSRPMVVGQTYTYNQYFQSEKNPVVLKVLRTERIDAPWGKVNAIVVRPIVKAKGMFSESSNAEVWFSDDSARVVLQMKVGLPVGSLTMKLKTYRASSSAETVRKP
jgi:hypothetical protein